MGDTDPVPRSIQRLNRESTERMDGIIRVSWEIVCSIQRLNRESTESRGIGYTATIWGDVRFNGSTERALKAPPISPYPPPKNVRFNGSTERALKVTEQFIKGLREAVRFNGSTERALKELTGSSSGSLVRSSIQRLNRESTESGKHGAAAAKVRRVRFNGSTERALKDSVILVK